MHCLIADKIKENPQLIDVAKNNLAKWRASYGNKPIPYYIVEWEVLLQKPLYQVLRFLRSTTQLAQQFGTGRIAVDHGFACLAQAQTFPAKPVNMVIPFAAGGPTDTLGRNLAAIMTTDLKQQVVIENSVGAGGTIAANRVAKAKPDASSTR